MPIQKNKTKSVKQARKTQEFDGVYLLKLVLYIILGSMWLKVGNGDGVNISLPVGLAAGLIFASHEHFRIDRKIEYAVLLVAMLVGYLAPYGLFISY